MPYVDGEYVQLTEAQIREQLNEFVDEVSNGEYKTSGTGVIPAILAAFSQEVAENQEPAIAATHDAAYLATADGKFLENVIAITGKERLDAVAATGAVRFSGGINVTSDITVPSGTAVQTAGTGSVEFTTQESITLNFIEGGEGDLSAYSGDVANFSITGSQAHSGSNSITHDGTAERRIYRSDYEMGPGDTLTFKYRADFGTDADNLVDGGILFGGTDADNCYELRVQDQSSSHIAIWKIESGVRNATPFCSLGDGTETILRNNEWMTVEVSWSLKNRFQVTLYDGTDAVIDQTTDVQDLTHDAGGVGFSTGANASTNFPFIDDLTFSARTAKVQASIAGEGGNVGKNRITVMPSPLAGITEINNPFTTGDTSINFRDGEPFTAGENEETDEELRDRVQDFTSHGGDVTYDGIIGGVIDAGARSVNIEFNNTATDNSGSGGLPPFSFEVIAFGGEDYDVAKAIFDRTAPTMSIQSGTYGTAVSKQIEAVNGQTFTIEFSRPTQQGVDIDVDLVVDSNYAGNDDVREAILNYAGGEDTNGARVYGLNPGEDVVISELTARLTAIEGVIGLNTGGPSSGISTSPATTTRGDGLEVVAIGTNEVAYVTEDNINITTTNATE